MTCSVRPASALAHWCHWNHCGRWNQLLLLLPPPPPPPPSLCCCSHAGRCRRGAAAGWRGRRRRQLQVPLVVRHHPQRGGRPGRLQEEDLLPLHRQGPLAESRRAQPTGRHVAAPAGPMVLRHRHHLVCDVRSKCARARAACVRVCVCVCLWCAFCECLLGAAV